MKSPIRIIIGLIGVLVLVAVGFLVVPRLLYVLPPFKSWVAGQIDKQSGGKFSFDAIQGDAFEARLAGAHLDLAEGKSHVVQAKFNDLTATFELLPVAILQLDLKELKAVGGEVVLKLAGANYEEVRLPVTAESLTMENGRLVIQNLQGYECVLDECQLSVFSTESGKKGDFSATSGSVGVIDLTGISGSFEFGPEGLKVTTFQAVIPGESALTLDGLLALGEEGAPVKDANLSVNTQDVQALLTALGYSDRFGGAAEVTATFSGHYSPEAKNLQGEGTAKLSGISAKVDLPSYPGFDGSGIFDDLSSISGLGGEVPFQLEADQIAVSSLPLANEKMKISGALTIGYDKIISGEHTLLASPAMASGIPSVAQEVFKKNGDGWTEIPFNFKGTSNAPVTDAGSVVSKALMNPVNAVKGVGGIFGGLFGGGDKKKEEKPAE
ncbi:MAG: hypothetical protein AAF571_11970 [Verrucomicrobiota bacterium]